MLMHLLWKLDVRVSCDHVCFINDMGNIYIFRGKELILIGSRTEAEAVT
jgi:hypothetical protein